MGSFSKLCKISKQIDNWAIIHWQRIFRDIWVNAFPTDFLYCDSQLIFHRCANSRFSRWHVQHKTIVHTPRKFCKTRRRSQRYTPYSHPTPCCTGKVEQGYFIACLVRSPCNMVQSNSILHTAEHCRRKNDRRLSEPQEDNPLTAELRGGYCQHLGGNSPYDKWWHCTS